MVGIVRVVYNGCRYMCMLFWASKVNYGIETVFTQVYLAVNWLNYLASPHGLCHLAGDKSNLLHHSPTMAEPRKSLWIRACGWKLVDKSWLTFFFVCHCMRLFLTTFLGIAFCWSICMANSQWNHKFEFLDFYFSLSKWKEINDVIQVNNPACLNRLYARLNGGRLPTACYVYCLWLRSLISKAELKICPDIYEVQVTLYLCSWF